MALNDRNSILENPDDRTTDSGMTPGLQFGTQPNGAASGGIVGAAKTGTTPKPTGNSYGFNVMSGAPGNADAGRAAYDAWRKSADDLTARALAANITSPNDPRLAGFQEEGQRIAAARSAAGTAWDAYSNPNNVDPSGGMKNIAGTQQAGMLAAGNGGAPNVSAPLPAPPESISAPDRVNNVPPPPPPTPYIGANTTTTGTTTGTNTNTTGTNTGIVGAAQGTPLTDPSTIKPVTGTVTADQLVEDRLTKLLGSDSPLIARARQRAAENATARGLQNSTMAVQAGEAAAIDAALPIATSDAKTYATQSLANQDSETQFGVEDKRFAGQRLLANEDRTFQGSENDKTRANAANIAAGNNATSMQVAQMDAASRASIASQELQGRLQVAGMDAASRAELEKMRLDATASQNIAQLNQNSLINFSNGFANIQSSSMEQAAKDNAMKNYLAIWAGSPYLPVGIDLTRLPTNTTNGGGGGA